MTKPVVFPLAQLALEELTAGFRLLILLTGRSFWSGIKDRGGKNDDHYKVEARTVWLPFRSLF